MRETRVLLLRHAETSAPDRFHGAESDVGLGVCGFQQAAAVAERLKALRPDALYCSAMLRARQTAEAIALACQLVPTIEPDLHERKMGPLSGLAREDALDAYTLAKQRWMAGDLDYTHEGGESYAQIRNRVVPVLKRLAEKSAGQTIVVVAHGVVIRVLLGTLLEGHGHADFGQFEIDNTAINDLRWDGSHWTAVALNQGVDHEPDAPAW